MKKIAAILATDNEQKLIDIAADNGELRQQISELVKMSRDLTLQVQHLKTMKQSEAVDPWVYIEDSTPEYATQPQPVAAPEQPVAAATPAQPVASPTQPVAEAATQPQPVAAAPAQPQPSSESAQVISISPEQLLDNKTIVIKIMMPRAAQIDTASDTGNTAAEQIASIVPQPNEKIEEPEKSDQQTLTKKDQEVEAEANKLREVQEQVDDPPPPYSEGGNKKINPAKVHPASLFNN